jgi:uncharacterized surface anchored protein
MAQTGRVRIRVTDPTGAVVPGAEVSVLGSDTMKPVRTERTNAAGEVAWTDLPFGDSRFTISQPGFRMRPLTVTLRDGDEVNLEAVLELVIVGTVYIVGSAPAPEPKRTKRRRWLIFR